MKATGFTLVLALMMVSGCRTARLGDKPVIRDAFAAQGQKAGTAPAPLDAEDARGVMARHREPMAPRQAGAPSNALGLEAPKLGPSTP